MYRSIILSEDFECNGARLPKLRFVVDSEGVPNDEVNDFLLYLATVRHLNIESTIDEAALCITFILNLLLKKVETNNGIKWNRVTSSILKKIANIISRDGTNKTPNPKNSTVNLYTSHFIQFLWWAEYEAGLTNGLVGINDIGRNKQRYRVALDPPKKSGHKYSIPWLLPTRNDGGGGRVKGDSVDWDRALDQVINHEEDSSNFKAVAKKHRDEIMLRLIRESSLRRIEVVHLDKSQFEAVPQSGVRRMWITLKKTKYYETRDVGIFTGLWYDIQDYIQSSRKELIAGKSSKSEALLPSIKTGQYLRPRSINTVLADYGVRPHDGRGLGLTEYMIDLVEKNVPQDEAILIVSEMAGHSLKGEGKVFLRHYLRAKEVVARANMPPRSQLEAENVKLRRQLVEALTKST